jgi:hypothetical protein
VSTATRPRAINLAVLNKLIVSAYKGLGFTILFAILVGLVSYLGTSAFFFLSRGWLCPSIMSPTDPHVIQLSSELSQQLSARDKLVAEKLDLAVKLRDAERTVAAEETFQSGFRDAVGTEYRARFDEATRLRELSEKSDQSKEEVARSTAAFAGMSRERLKELYDAHLIDQDAYVKGAHELSQLAVSSLGLAQKDAEISGRLATLAREMQALGATGASLVPQTNGDGAAIPMRPRIPLTYDVLRIQHEYDRSVLELNRARDVRDGLTEGIKSIEQIIARYDRLIKGLSESGYLKAWEHGISVAFVPYENLGNVTKSEVLYGCRLGLAWCHKVGRVVGALDGEVTGKHPLRNTELRGVMVEIRLDEAGYGEKPVLYAGRPLFIL